MTHDHLKTRLGADHFCVWTTTSGREDNLLACGAVFKWCDLQRAEMHSLFYATCIEIDVKSLLISFNHQPLSLFERYVGDSDDSVIWRSDTIMQNLHLCKGSLKFWSCLHFLKDNYHVQHICSTACDAHLFTVAQGMHRSMHAQSASKHHDRSVHCRYLRHRRPKPFFRCLNAWKSHTTPSAEKFWLILPHFIATTKATQAVARGRTRDQMSICSSKNAVKGEPFQWQHKGQHQN